MNIDQLRAFANSPEAHIRQIALTREAARAIVAEHDREVAKNMEPGFELDVRRNSGPLDAELTLKRFRRMQAEDARGCL